MNFYYLLNSSGQHFCGFDQNDNPIWQDSPSVYVYSWSQTRLQNYADDNEIDDATVTASSGGNAPPQGPGF